MKSRITASNFTRLIHSFQQYNLKNLFGKAIEFCLENFDPVCETPEFFDIEEHVWEIFLPDDRLNLSESSIFRALVKWTEHDLESRKAAFERLVKHVRFATIDAPELSELSRLELAGMSGPCEELIAKVNYYLGRGHQNKQSQDMPLAEVSATPRRNLRNSQRMYAIGGIRRCPQSGLPRYIKTLSSVEIYNPFTNQWTEAAPMHYPREGFGFAVLDDHIYVAGGFNEGEMLNTFERYNAADNTWEILPMMSKPRRKLALVALDGCLYAIGGCIPASVGRILPSREQWESRAPMLTTTQRQILGAA